MKNAVFWDIKSSLYLTANISHLRYKQFSATAVSMKNAVFWNVMPYGSCKNRYFGGTYRFRHQDDVIGELGTTLAASISRSTP
jgi:hypothetical protein